MEKVQKMIQKLKEREVREWNLIGTIKKESNKDINDLLDIAYYSDFFDFVKSNFLYLEELEELLEGPDKKNEKKLEKYLQGIMKTEETFHLFMEENVLSLNLETQLSYAEAKHPFLSGVCLTCLEGNQHFLPIKKIKTEDDLIYFANEILKDLGEVTTSKGAGNQYFIV